MEGNQTKAKPSEAPPRRLLDQVRDSIRRRHYSPRTEEAYVHWIKRFIYFSGRPHPCEMSAPEVTQSNLIQSGQHANVLDHASAQRRQRVAALEYRNDPALRVPVGD